MPNKALKKLTTGTIIIAKYWQIPCEWYERERRERERSEAHRRRELCGSKDAAKGVGSARVCPRMAEVSIASPTSQVTHSQTDINGGRG